MAEMGLKEEKGPHLPLDAARCDFYGGQREKKSRSMEHKITKVVANVSLCSQKFQIQP